MLDQRIVPSRSFDPQIVASQPVQLKALPEVGDPLRNRTERR
jgi:hypothetical protein